MRLKRGSYRIWESEGFVLKVVYQEPLYASDWGSQWLAVQLIWDEERSTIGWFMWELQLKIAIKWLLHLLEGIIMEINYF